jgi:hypothetical protein
MAIVSIVTVCFVPETLPPSARNGSRFSLGSSSPLAFFKLFRNGAGLACAVIMQTVDYWCDGK